MPCHSHCSSLLRLVSCLLSHPAHTYTPITSINDSIHFSKRLFPPTPQQTFSSFSSNLTRPPTTSTFQSRHIIRITHILTQTLPPNLDLLTLLQDKKHPRPLRRTHILPSMTSPPLHRHIPPAHNLLRPIIQPHLHLPLQHDSIV